MPRISIHRICACALVLLLCLVSCPPSGNGNQNGQTNGTVDNQNVNENGSNANLNINENGDGLVEGAFYVSASLGDDSTAGTQEQPWQTIQKAADTLTAGQTVYIMEGTYAEQVLPENSGNEGAYIVYAAFTGAEVTIDGETITLEDDTGLFEVTGKSYIKISGLTVSNSGPADNAAGILVNNSDHITIENCYTYNTMSSGIGVWSSNNIIIDGNEVELACNDGEQECITVAGTDTFEVRNNHIHHNGQGTIGGEGIDAKDGSSNGKIYNNHVHDLNNRLGIYIEAWDKHTYNIEIYGNIVHDVVSAAGFVLASEMGGPLENIRVYNNIAYNNGCSGLSVSVGDEDAPVETHPLKDIYVINNTFYNNGSDNCFGADWGGRIGVDNPDIENVVIRNNICSQNRVWQIALEEGVPAAQLTIDHNLIDGFRDELGEETRGTDYVEGEPLFVDSAAGDFHLQEGSPALDTGSSSEAPEDDYEGTSRPQGAGIDIGAFES